MFIGVGIMKFNFHAVGKKDRIKKALIICTPIAILIGLVGALILPIVRMFYILYYPFILGIGYVVGTMVRKVGRGTTIEFLVIAGVLAAISIFITMYFSYTYQGFSMDIMTFLKNDLFNIINIRSSYTIVELGLGVVVAVSQATTVQFIS